MTIRVWMDVDHWVLFHDVSSYEIDSKTGVLKIYANDSALWNVFPERGWIRMAFCES